MTTAKTMPADTSSRLARALLKERNADDAFRAAAKGFAAGRVSFDDLKLAARKATNATHEVGRATKNEGR